MSAGRLADAGRVARLLIYLLEKADARSEATRALLDDVTSQERTQWLRADGRIEPRKRFKGGPVVRVRDPARHFLFIDESGKSLPGGSPYFALGAIAMTGTEVVRYRRRADAVKQRFFARHQVTFHEPGMRRRVGDFSFGDDPARQLAFDRAARRIGAAWYRLLTAPAPGHGYLDDATPEVAIGIGARWRGRGVGTALMERPLALAEDSGVHRLSLSVSTANPAAVRLYRRAGFETVREEHGHLLMLWTSVPEPRILATE